VNTGCGFVRQGGISDNVLALGAVADLASLIFNSEHKTVNTPQKLMRGRMFN
jgi:hypothetical protein